MACIRQEAGHFLLQLNSQPFPDRFTILDFCCFQMRVSRDEKVGQRQHAEYDDDRVRQGAKGSEKNDGTLFKEFCASGHPQPVFEGDPGLNGAHRQKSAEGHQKQPAVKTPEGQLQDAVFPVGVVHPAAPGEEQQGKRVNI